MRLTICYFLFLSFIFALNAEAQTLKQTLGDWKVFTHTENGKKLCYIASTPVKKTGTYKKRDAPFVLVTHRSAKVDEISVSSGFAYKKASEVSMLVDKKNFALFTQAERAWAYDEKEDAQIVSRMAGGKTLSVKGTSEKGTTAEDSYSLNGFTKARLAMKTLCNNK